MPIKIYNTLGRELQTFEPVNKTPDKDGRIVVNMYHCGPTVYWDQHIGNLRSVVLVDLIKKTFEYNNYKITLVRNYTDVGHLTSDNLVGHDGHGIELAETGIDRMDKAANREGLTPDAIADKYIASFERDTTLLKANSADSKPRATTFIKEMQKMINELLIKGFAYETTQGIYFDISQYPKYTELSGQKLDLQNTHSGHGEVSDEQKRNSADFALWIYAIGTHAGASQTWEYSPPFGDRDESRGFPGWHIECSAMSKALLGTHLDIHMGGIEHIPVHHTNEIAQSESANGEKYVNYWIHNEHLLVDNKKMSKSEGTSYLLSDIIAKDIGPLALRYFFLQAHYRSKQNFTWEALEASSTAYKKLKRQMKILSSSDMAPPFTGENGFEGELYTKKFLKSVNNDFNTPQALAIVWTLLKDKNINSNEKLNLIYKFNEVLGLDL